MNYSTAIFLINEHARAVAVCYEPDGKRTIFKTLDPEVEVDDLVVVETDTRHGYTVCKVVEVDIDLDMDSQQDVRWIVSRLDTSHHDELRGQETEAIKAIKSAELRKKREDLRNAMFKDHTETLKELPIAAISNPGAALEAPEGKEA